MPVLDAKLAAKPAKCANTTTKKNGTESKHKTHLNLTIQGQLTGLFRGRQWFNILKVTGQLLWSCQAPTVTKKCWFPQTGNGRTRLRHNRWLQATTRSNFYRQTWAVKSFIPHLLAVRRLEPFFLQLHFSIHLHRGNVSSCWGRWWTFGWTQLGSFSAWLGLVFILWQQLHCVD